MCFDEQQFTLRADAHAGEPCAPGRAARVEYDPVRQGTARCLLGFARLHGWRHVTVSAHRRNVAEAGATWRFTTADAQMKLAQLYSKLA